MDREKGTGIFILLGYVVGLVIVGAGIFLIVGGIRNLTTDFTIGQLLESGLMILVSAYAIMVGSANLWSSFLKTRYYFLPSSNWLLHELFANNGEIKSGVVVKVQQRGGLRYIFYRFDIGSNTITDHHITDSDVEIARDDRVLVLFTKVASILL